MSTRDRVNKAKGSPFDFGWNPAVPRKPGLYIVMEVWGATATVVCHTGGEVQFLGTDEVCKPKEIRWWGPRLEVGP